MRPEDVEQLKAIGRLLQEPEPPSPTPISLGCHATASSIWQNDPQWGADKAVDGDSDTRWGGGVGTKKGWLELDLGMTKQFDSILIDEGWDRTQRFELQVKDNDQWRTILEGKTIGRSFSRKVPPIKARYVRLNILEAKDVPTIWEFQLFDESAAKRCHRCRKVAATTPET